MKATSKYSTKMASTAHSGIRENGAHSPEHGCHSEHDNMHSPEHDGEWYSKRIECLRQFMLEKRYDNFRKVLDMRTRWMTVCMENTFHPQNASALVRTCEAFGLQEIHAIEDLCRFQPSVDIVRGTDKWVDIHSYKSSNDALAALRQAGYRIIATTPHREHGIADVVDPCPNDGRNTTLSAPRREVFAPEKFDVAKGKFALVFGTEHAGISEEMIRSADEFVCIPMCGFVESLNLSASAAILIHMLASRLRRSDAQWQLSESEKLPILLKWMMGSVHDSENILLEKDL